MSVFFSVYVVLNLQIYLPASFVVIMVKISSDGYLDGLENGRASGVLVASCSCIAT